MGKKFIDHRYLIETNRCRGDSIRRMARRLEAKGYEVERTLHKTTLLLRRPKGNTFSTFESDIASELQSRCGSAVICSTSGRQWMCRMGGNRPGDMVRL
jgi:hypothetical protein